jgi:hypothetical protein
MLLITYVIQGVKGNTYSHIWTAVTRQFREGEAFSVSRARLQNGKPIIQ